MKSEKDIKRAIKQARGIIIESGEDGLACQIPRTNDTFQYQLMIVLSWGGDWDHASVHADSLSGQFTPFWEDMAFVKHLFFKPSECAVQYHPAKADYINCHRHTLHLWRPQNIEIIIPPKEFV